MNDIKNVLVKLYNETMEELSPCKVIKNFLLPGKNSLIIRDRVFNFEKLFVTGFGKGACTMAEAIEKLFPAELIDGIIVTKYGHTIPLAKIKVFEAGHPVPDENSIKGTDKILEALDGLTGKELVLFLISGGGSALLEKPADGLSLCDIQYMTELLLNSGAAIDEINIIRKHLSSVKGGKLASRLKGCQYISIILSDVIGSDPGSIASGPTVRDYSTLKDCKDIIKKYNLTDKIPVNITTFFKEKDVLKPDEAIFEKGSYYIIADNSIFCKLLEKKAREEGLVCHYIDTPFTTTDGEEFIEHLGEIIKCYKKESNCLLVLGGEVTLKIPEGTTGKGGRNQHLTLLFTKKILPYNPEVTALFASTDGTDGPTDGSGGFSERRLLKYSDELDDAILNYNSYNFLNKYESLFFTGPTGNNLNDVFLIYLP